MLRDCSIDEVRGYIDQLLAHGLLQQTRRQLPGAATDRRGRGADENGRRGATISRWRGSGGQKRAARRRVRASKSNRGTASIGRLFERLRAMRLEIARARGVPPYVIFHDSTLRELARVKPKSLRELAGHLRHGRA